jgi:hypothetical protein
MSHSSQPSRDGLKERLPNDDLSSSYVITDSCSEIL